MSRRVVISGLGLVTPVGTGREEVWKNMLAGQCGVRPIQSFDTEAYSVHRGAEVLGFRAEEFVARLDPAQMGRASQFAASAARMALADSGLDTGAVDPDLAGVAMGTTSGEPLEVERLDDRYIAEELDQVGSEFISRYPCHMIAETVASEVDFCGPNVMIPTACAAGNYAIAYAYDALREGRAEVMLAGGADSFSRITFSGFACLGAIAPEYPQPFDKNRKGMVPGEGAAVLVLEPMEAALARGATIYAEISGYGLSCDAHHMTGAHPEGDGAARAMEQALRQSGLQPDDVSYVSAHGTGTPSNDKLETLAVKRVFPEASRRPPVSSVKSMIGHTMGAASAIEAAICALAIQNSRIPPTIHFEEVDPECDIDCVPNEAREQSVEVAMNNAYAFGGNNASLILRRFLP